jgi:hypothetical protein
VTGHIQIFEGILGISLEFSGQESVRESVMSSGLSQTRQIQICGVSVMSSCISATEKIVICKGFSALCVMGQI